MKTPSNGTNLFPTVTAGAPESLDALHTELLRLEDLAKHYSLTEVELLVGAAAEAASEALNRVRRVLN